MPRRHCVRLAADQLIVELHLADDAVRAVIRAAQAHAEQADRFAAHVADRLADGGERGPDGAGERGVVEAADADVARHVELALMRDGDGGGRHVVIAGEDGGGRRVEAEQLFGGVEARAEGEVARRDQRCIGGDAMVGKAVAKSLQAARAGAVAGIAFDKADAAMAEVDQMAREVIGGVAIIGSHGQHVGPVPVGRDGDDEDVALRQLFDQLRPVAQGRRQDDAGDMRLRHLIDDFLREGAGRALFDHQMQVALRRFRQRAQEQFAQIGGGGAVAVQQGDAAIRAAGERAGRGVGDIAQRLDRLRHRFARTGADQRLAVDGARCGHDRYAGMGGDILDRGRLAVVSLHRDRSLAILQAKENRP